MMKYVIRHDHDESLRYDETISDGLSPAAFRVAKRDFLQRGVLSKRMLERIWVPLQLSAEFLVGRDRAGRRAWRRRAEAH